uniref:Laminin subunit gamma 2 n=1 Tax=Electrophorus electricus TaxID=8005 RepID=A0A4W4EDL9_ELEEL
LPLMSCFCVCNGKALYCVRDSLGLRCEKCQENTEGRHCESCKEGFYHQRAGELCLPCSCNTAGSEGPGCNSEGQCVCKQGVQGSRCDLCANGAPVTSQGCRQQTTCLCYGHSKECSPAQGYSIHNITSTFDRGTDGWRTITAQRVNPSKVQFRWSPTHGDVEVISKDVLPVYLSAPAVFLGNQALSYGQKLSFSLRLDRGVRHPSTSDVMLEGNGLTVSASLGDLRTVIPCGRKITYTFRLDEQPGGRWKPHLSAEEFQTLLSNLTAIKIRATFGEDGRGYLDNVTLVSARVGSGAPAGWVKKCRCPVGYQGQFCEHCAAGYKRRFPDQGPRSPCESCTCRGGNCDPETGDCYSADETPASQPCSAGFYSDPWHPRACLRCPCALGSSCSVAPGMLDVRCSCPPGATGSRCQHCDNGFYGDPLGEHGMARPCQRCQCNGHLDPVARGNCDSLTGECLKCLDNTTGPRCEKCVEGFHRHRPTDVCQACRCDPQGSVSSSCSPKGQCRCKEGFHGNKCEREACPSCFNPIKSQIEKYTQKLKELEALFNSVGRGEVHVTVAVETAIHTAEEMVQSLKNKADALTDAEARLQDKLLAIGSSQQQEDGNLQEASRTVKNIIQQDQKQKEEVADIQNLISNIRKKLQKAKQDISEEFPLSDAEAGTSTIASLVQKAADLADKHQGEAAAVELTARNAVLQAENALARMRSVVTGENQVREQLNDLKSQYERDVALVEAMQKQAARLSTEAGMESRVSEDALNQISDLENNLPKAPKKAISGLVATLDGLKDLLASEETSYQKLQKGLLADQREAEDLMNEIKTAQQAQDKLLHRANAIQAEAEKSLQIFSQLDNVDQALDKLRGFEGQISRSKTLADEALRKLPIINATIQQATANNDKTQVVLDQLSSYSDTLDALDKLNGTLAKVEKMSASLAPSSDVLKTATKLRGGLEGLKTKADSTMNQLTKEKKNAEREQTLAGEVNQEANEVFNKAKDAKDAVGATLKTVNDLLGLLGTPDSVDEKRMSDLERAVVESRSRIEQDLKPRLRELTDREVQQRSAITRMLSDIDTILEDIANLEDIRRNIPDGCYNTAPIERP